MKRRTALKFLRQASLASLAAMAVGGCGFKLRSSQNYAFATIAIMPNPGGALALELRRSFGSAVHVLSPEEPLDKAQLVFDLLSEQREKIVVAVNSSGEVRELQLRIRVKFRVRTPQGEERVPESEILQQRDISFNESAVLAKEAEEGLLYRDMQSDIVQQLLRRLAAIK